MTAATIHTIRLPRITFLVLTAARIVIISGTRHLLTRVRVIIDPAELFAAAPTPGTAAALANMETCLSIQAACEYIVARCVLQGPTFAPRTHLCVVGHCSTTCRYSECSLVNAKFDRPSTPPLGPQWLPRSRSSHSGSTSSSYPIRISGHGTATKRVAGSTTQRNPRWSGARFK